MPGTCWDNPTHVFIAKLAEILLPQKSKKQLRKLMEQSLPDTATWAHWATKTFPATEELHFQPQHEDWVCSILHLDKEPSLCHGVHGSPHDPHCLYSALHYFHEQFAHPELLKEFKFEAQKVPSLPNLADHVPPELLTDAGNLKWLQGLTADMHQPLHWGMKSNDYGRQIKVVYGEGSQRIETTLYDFWETVLPREAAKDEERLVKHLQESYTKRQDAWKHHLFPRNLKYWSEDLVRKACLNIYDHLRQSPTPPAGQEHSKETNTLKNPFTVDENLFQQWKHMAGELLVIASQRTVHSLLDVLEHRKHVLHHKDGRGRHHVKKYWVENLAKNLAVTSTLVPLLLLLLCWHGGYSVPQGGPLGPCLPGRSQKKN